MVSQSVSLSVCLSIYQLLSIYVHSACVSICSYPLPLLSSDHHVCPVSVPLTEVSVAQIQLQVALTQSDTRSAFILEEPGRSARLQVIQTVVTTPRSIGKLESSNEGAASRSWSNRHGRRVPPTRRIRAVVDVGDEPILFVLRLDEACRAKVPRPKLRGAVDRGTVPLLRAVRVADHGDVELGGGQSRLEAHRLLVTTG